MNNINYALHLRSVKPNRVVWELWHSTGLHCSVTTPISIMIWEMNNYLTVMVTCYLFNQKLLGTPGVAEPLVISTGK